ncbi:MAG: hypothetical protein Q7S12_00230 [bacterium]|nr:hypothetical protein [bacterium]
MKKYTGFLLGLLFFLIASPTKAEVVVDNGNYAYIRLRKSNCDGNLGLTLSVEIDAWVKSKQEIFKRESKETLRTKVLKIQSTAPQLEIGCFGSFVSAVVGIHIFYSKD